MCDVIGWAMSLVRHCRGPREEGTIHISLKMSRHYPSTLLQRTAGWQRASPTHALPMPKTSKKDVQMAALEVLQTIMGGAALKKKKAKTDNEHAPKSNEEEGGPGR